MADEKKAIARKPRADAARNRQRLLETARQAFTEKGVGVSLDEIARLAGVGIGTLYRHFPTRDALLEQVYRHQSEQLFAAAERLATERAPVEALSEWLKLFVDYISTKQIMADALAAMVGGTAELYESSGQRLKESINALVRRAEDSGELRMTLEPFDLMRAVVGVGNFGADPGWEARAKSLVDILLAGMATRQG